MRICIWGIYMLFQHHSKNSKDNKPKRRDKGSKLRAEKGCLIHVPSETMMVDFPSASLAKESMSFDSPKVFLVVEKCGAMCKVFYNGKNWYVSENKVYRIGK